MSLIFTKMLGLYAIVCFFVTCLYFYLVIRVIEQCWVLYNWHFYILCRCFVHIMTFDATVVQVRGLTSYKTGPIYRFLHKKMPVPCEEYDSCWLIVWCVSAFDFAILLVTFRFEFSSEISIFVISLIVHIFLTIKMAKL